MRLSQTLPVKTLVLSAALTLWAVSELLKCFGISVTGLTHQKQCRGLQQRHTVSTAPFMFCSGSPQFHVSQQQVRRGKIMEPTCCYHAFLQRQWNMSNSVCLMKDWSSTGLSWETISDFVTWPGCKGVFYVWHSIWNYCCKPAWSYILWCKHSIVDGEEKLNRSRKSLNNSRLKFIIILMCYNTGWWGKFYKWDAF